jgi:hypothetical protein
MSPIVSSPFRGETRRHPHDPPEETECMSNARAIEKALVRGLQASADLLQLVFEDLGPERKWQLAQAIARGASMRVSFRGLPTAAHLVIELEAEDGTVNPVLTKALKT